MDKIETIQELVNKCSHKFYCDNCNKFLRMNKECYAYKVTMEKLKLIKSIFFNYK